ncbi:MAG: hypothetical protein CVU90_02660 [Firmicutes bacterium HGW-Firmicutes-15]|nr:MAG: hypothetical protein CVU90_02660 [Firmicutes bacterium HGW-Firmicutes-15]
MSNALLTNILVELVKEQNDNGQYGVNIINLPSFDYKQFLDGVEKSLQRRLEVFFLGFQPNEEYEILKDQIPTEALKLCFSVEEAEKSRNSGDESIFRIMVIKRKEIEKLSSLLWFPEVDLNTIYKRSCKQVEKSLSHNNSTIKALLKALGRQDIRAILNLERLLEYLEALLDTEASNLPVAIKDNLYKLGLCIDSTLDTGNPDIDEIKKRIKRNREIVNRIGALEQAERKSISQYAAKNTNNATVKAILEYYKTKDIEVLKKLELLDVEECLKNVKREPGKKTPLPVKGTINPTALAAQLAFEDDKEEIESILEQLTKDINERENVEKPTTVIINSNGVKLTIKTEPVTEKIAHDFIDESNFGGIIYADVSNPKDAIEALSKYTFVPFDNQYLAKARDYLRNFENHLKMVQCSQLMEPKKNILHYMENFLHLREGIVGDAIRLQDSPMLQVIAQKIKYVAYLNAYADLLCVVRESFPLMWQLDPSASKDIINAIISLDVVYIIGNNDCHAIPTPLNPLYLWKYIKLAEEIINSKSVDGVLDAEAVLSEDDKEFIIRKAEDIPDPLAVILLSNNVREQGAIFLPLSGRIGCLPIYSSIQQINQVESGIDSLNQAIVRYLMLYPHAGLMLRLCLINPPSVGLVVDMLKRLNKDKEFNIDGIQLVVYRTKEASRDWVEINDKSINEGFLSRIKGADSGRFKISIINKVYSYDKILREIKREQHLIVIFDPNEKKIDNAKNNPLIHVHPLCIPKVYECSPLSAEITIRPANEGGIFSDYINIVEKLNERPSSFSSTGLFYNTPIKESTYKELLSKTDWLVILDQNLKAWDLSLSSTSEKLYYKAHEYREMGIYSLHSKKFLKGFTKLISDMGNYMPQESGVQNIIDAIRSINDDGLLSIVSHATNYIFDEKHGKGSAGLAIAAIEYKAQKPGSLLVGLDTQLAREWLADRENGKLPDLIGITLDDSNNALIDVIEVKTHSGDYSINEDIISGRAVDQVMVIEGLIHEMMGSNEKITTTSRKEILRAQVFESLLQKDVSAEYKHISSQKLNELFAGKCRISINREIVYVAFSDSESSKKKYKTVAELGEKQIQLSIIGSNIIQKIVAGSQILSSIVAEVGDNNEPGDFHEDNTSEQDLNKYVKEENSKNTEHKKQVSVSDNFEEKPKDIVSKKLHEDTDKESEIKEKQAEKCIRLTRVLRDFGIQAAPVDSDLVQQAARFMRFKLELRSGETIAKLEKYKVDISRELEAYGEILLSNLKGTRYVSMDVPFNDGGKPLLLTEHLAMLPRENGKLGALAGQMPDGEIEYFDVAQAPHILIAGTTGSGKTIFLYSLIVSLIYQYDADELELLIVDPKQTDFIFFNTLPHLRYNEVLTDSEQALKALDDIINIDLEERTSRLKESMSRDILSYNEKNPLNKMRRLVVVIDEYADLVQVAEILGIRKDFEGKICRLAQRVRNLGIHLVIATQRPNAATVTSALKANIPFRISFRLPAHQDSMTILDRSGAEDLLGKGDMLMVTESDIKRVQGLFISEDELTDFISKYPGTKR